MEDGLYVQRAWWETWRDSREARHSESQLRFDPLNPRPTLEEEARFWREEVETDAFRIWEIQHLQRGLLGFICLFQERGGHWETGVGILREDRWGAGIARRAYERLIPLWTAEGLPGISAITHAENIRARRLFHRLGFALRGQLMDSGVPMVRYWLELGRG